MARYFRTLGIAAVSALFGLVAAGAAADPPKVVVSIKPLHSLVAAAMDGIAIPVLLVQSGADPHSHALKPSEAAALGAAQLVIWAGEGVETFLAKPVATLARKARVIRLDRQAGLRLHRAREGGPWEGHDAHDEGDDHDRKHDRRHGEIDGHLWLDPDNAAAIVRIAVRELSTLDPANAARYAANGTRTAAALKALDADLRRRFAPVRARRFIVSHDSLQYLEKRYGLAVAGSISISPERPPSARRLYEIRARIVKERVVCVFGEPQLPDRLVRTAVEGTSARTGVLDTDGGMKIAEGKDAYFAMMRNLADALTGCLAGR